MSPDESCGQSCLQEKKSSTRSQIPLLVARVKKHRVSFYICLECGSIWEKNAEDNCQPQSSPLLSTEAQMNLI